MNFSELTTLKIGGPIKKVILIKTEEELTSNLQSLIFNHQSYLVIGGGSNLLVSDEGFSGAIIKNEITGIERQGNDLVVKSGTILQNLVDYANRQGLGGLENLAGIPGTVGGAIYGNAGAYGQTVSDHLISVKAFKYTSATSSLHPELGSITTGATEQKSFSRDDCRFNYRDSIFKSNKFIIIEAVFSLTHSDPETLKQTSSETIKKREVKYPPGIKCPGSFFKNIPSQTLSQEILQELPENFILYGKVSAGALLESVGAKGAKQGDILISPYHANLFINQGRGTAEDFYSLAKTYSQKVYEKHRIRLEPEVQLINLPPLI